MRMDLAEILFRKHNLCDQVDTALGRVRKGRWLSEWAAHMRARVRDDDMLFRHFRVYEERF